MPESEQRRGFSDYFRDLYDRHGRVEINLMNQRRFTGPPDEVGDDYVRVSGTAIPFTAIGFAREI